MNTWTIIAWTVMGGAVAVLVALTLLFVAAFVIRGCFLALRWYFASVRWRKNIKVGDSAIFQSATGNIVGKITQIYDNGAVLFGTKQRNSEWQARKTPDELWAFVPYVKAERRDHLVRVPLENTGVMDGGI